MTWQNFSIPSSPFRLWPQTALPSWCSATSRYNQVYDTLKIEINLSLTYLAKDVGVAKGESVIKSLLEKEVDKVKNLIVIGSPKIM